MRMIQFVLAFAALLVVAPSLSFAIEDIQIVTQKQAKEMGLEIRSIAAGTDAVRIELEFAIQGKLKDYQRVALELHDGKMLATSTLNPEKSKSGRIVVSFAADRTKVELFSFKVVTQSSPRSRIGYVIPVKDFVNVAALPAQSPTPESTARRKFNQVFVKVIVPVTARTPKQDGPVVESWVAEQLKHLGESEYFAVTDWVPVCDGLLEDDIVDNDVWDGRLDHIQYCPVCGDIPKRKNGQVLVNVGGFTPGGGEANMTLPDEPGRRTVGPVRFRRVAEAAAGKEGKRIKIEQGLPYVAVIIAPPPQ